VVDFGWDNNANVDALAGGNTKYIGESSSVTGSVNKVTEQAKTPVYRYNSGKPQSFEAGSFPRADGSDP
jgi:hypothetical protein